jgi:voltage-gated potassium channel
VANQPRSQHPARWIERLIKTKGLRPRFAAYVIVALWGAAIVVFGVIEHLVDPETFDTVWLGMWWAIQTVTTVGYGDVVPEQTAGKVIASFLMLGGLSLIAVVTGVITSAFVTQAQEERRETKADPVMEGLEQVRAELQEIKSELAGRHHSGDA